MGLRNPGGPSRQVWGYIPDFDVAAAFESARANRHLLAGLTLVRYHLDADGNLVEYALSQPLPAWVAAEGPPVVPLIANQLDGQWRSDLVGQIIEDPDRRRAHVEAIVDRLVQGHYPGVEMDYEFLPATLRDPFSQFIDELGAALHGRGKQLAVAVHAKQSEPGEGEGPPAQDWARIGAAADRVAVMTYDFDPSCPGPIAPLAWTRDALRFAVSCIPPSKVMQGIPLYGYIWKDGGAPEYLTYREFVGIAERYGLVSHRDPVDHHLVLTYEENGAAVEAWLPDHGTVAALAEIGREVGVAGYTVWRLGGEEPSAVASLRVETRSS